jgi:hypothetical protein
VQGGVLVAHLGAGVDAAGEYWQETLVDLAERHVVVRAEFVGL